MIVDKIITHLSRRSHTFSQFTNVINHDKIAKTKIQSISINYPPLSLGIVIGNVFQIIVIYVMISLKAFYIRHNIDGDTCKQGKYSLSVKYIGLTDMSFKHSYLILLLFGFFRN